MRIDCAVSLCDRAQFTYSWAPHRDYSAADLTAILSRNRFDGAIVLAQTLDPAETDWLIALARQEAWMLGVVTRVQDPLNWDRWQADPKFLGAEAASPSVAVELESRELVCLGTPEIAEALLGAAPRSRIVVRATASLMFEPGGFDAWARVLEPLKATTAMIQIDGLLNRAGPGGWRPETYRPWVVHLLERFGPARIIYGSGWPLSMPHHTWKESLACFTQAMGAQAMGDRSLMLGENAAKFYPRLVRGRVY
jgi:L-fuconolactonase